MKKYISLILILFLLLNTNFISSAYADEKQVQENNIYQYQLNDDYKSNFLISNDSNLNYAYSADEDSGEPIHPNWVILNLLFPGLGSLVVGEFVGGSILFTLALIPVIYYVFFLKRDGGGGVDNILSFFFVTIPLGLLLYLINLLVTGSIHADLFKKYREYYKNKEKGRTRIRESSSDVTSITL